MINKADLERNKGYLDVNWVKAQKLLKENKMGEARDVLDYCLALLGAYTIANYQIIDNVKIDLWKERVWYALENNNLLLG